MPHNMDPTKIESEKVYQQMGLSDEEYQKAKEIMGRHPNYTETGIFLLCGQNIVVIKLPNHY